MNSAIELRVRKIQNFGRIARAVCSAAVVVTVLGGLAAGFLLAGGAPTTLDLGAISFPGDIDSPPMRVWFALVMLVNLVLFFKGARLVWRLFDHLAKGEIYAAGPVRALQGLGRLMLFAATLQILVPLATILLTQTSVIALPATVHYSVHVSFGLLSGFATAGILLLLSWILDVGLSLREERDTLRQDAELVV